MTTITHPALTTETANVIRDQWLARLTTLVETVRDWAVELGWSVRQFNSSLDDSEIGIYDAPALLLQLETTRILLEPIARSAPGTEGIVDLYVMPAYDDIASFYFVDGEWRLHHTTPPSATVRDGNSVILSKGALQQVLEGLRRNAAQAT